MAGKFLEGTSKILSGVYTLIKAVISAVILGDRGVVSFPFTSDWGPVNVLRSITNASEFDVTYNGSKTALTASKIFLHAYNGIPKKLLAYRMAVGAAAKGEATLAVATGTAWVLETLYESARAFTAIVRTNPAGGFYFEIVENSIKLQSTPYTTIEELADLISVSDYVRVKTLGTELPSLAAGVAFAGGDNGSPATATEYTAYLTALEGDLTANAFSLDGVTDTGIIATTVAWVKRVTDEGFYVTYVNGGPIGWDTTISLANADSKVHNHNDVVNVGNGVDGYTAAEMAIYVAARVGSIALNMTITDETTPYQVVNHKLTISEREIAKLSGTLVFVQNGDFVDIDEGVNTLTIPPEGLSKEFGKIRINNAMNQIAGDLEKFGNEYKKRLSNTDAARETYAAAVEDEYLREMAVLGVLQEGYFYRPDPDYHGSGAIHTPAIDEAFYHADLTPIDSMERIYQKLGVQF